MENYGIPNFDQFPKVSTDIIINEVIRTISTFGPLSIEKFEFLKNQHSSILIRERHPERLSCDSENSDNPITKATTVDAIENFFLSVSKKYPQLDSPIHLHLIPDQVSLMCVGTNRSYALKICFSVYIRSLSLLADCLSRTSEGQSVPSKQEKKLANEAISILFNTKLPPLFYPDFNEKCIKTIINLKEVCGGEIVPISPTSIASNETTIFIGCKGPVIYSISMNKSIDIQKTEISDFPENEPYSLIYKNGFLLLCSQSQPALLMDHTQKCTFTLPVSHRSNIFSVLHYFSPPAITDGEFLYSINFGDSPRVKIFLLDPYSILFVTSVKLFQSDSTKLTPPFTELLPLSQKENASIATNGVYISFIFSSDNVTICRTFLLQNGVHQCDVIMPTKNIQTSTHANKYHTNNKYENNNNGLKDGNQNISSNQNINNSNNNIILNADEKFKVQCWTFDTNRPSHLLVYDNCVVMLDSCFTLPKWLIGYDVPEGTPKYNGYIKPVDICDGFSHALAIFASRLIGTETTIPFNFSNQCYKNTLGKCICKFIETSNKCAAQAFLVFLGIIIQNDLTDSSDISLLLNQFSKCLEKEQYEYLNKLIVFVFISSLDVFCKEDGNKTAEILLKIIKAESHKNVLFKFLPKSKYLTKALTRDSLLALCDLALKTSFAYDDEAISLLRELQYHFLTDESGKLEDLTFEYLKQIQVQFCRDYNEFYNDIWSSQRLIDSVSFIVYSDLMMLMKVSFKHNLKYGIEIAKIFFKVGSLPRFNLEPERGNQNFLIITDVLTRSLYLYLEMGFNLIDNDLTFYHMNNAPKNGKNLNYMIYPNSNDLKNIDFSGFSDNFVSIVKNTIFNSCTFGLDNEKISHSINEVLGKVRTNEINQYIFLEKCKKIETYQPQVFEKIMKILKYDSKEVIIVSEPHKSNIIQFLLTLTLPEMSIDENRTTLSLFIPIFSKMISHFIVLPDNLILEFLNQFNLRFMLPAEIYPDIFTFKGSDVINLELPYLLKCYDCLSVISKQMKNSEVLNVPIKLWLLTDSSYRPELLKNVLLREFASKSSPSTVDVELLLLIMRMGDYEILYHCLNCFVDSNETPIEITDFCFNSIGNFLNRENNAFNFQTNKSTCYQCIMLMCDFLRGKLSKGKSMDVLNYIEKILDSDELINHKKNKVALFAIMNNSIDIIRPFISIEFFDTKNLVFIERSKITNSSSTYFSINEDNFEYEIKACRKILLYPINAFKAKRVSNLYEKIINKLFYDFSFFEEKNPFYFACLSEFFKESVDNFWHIFSINKLIEQINDFLFFSNRSPYFLNNEFALTYFHSLVDLPSFSFDDKISNEFMGPQNKGIICTFENKINSSQRCKYISTPFPTIFKGKMTIRNKSKSETITKNTFEINVVTVSSDHSFTSSTLSFSDHIDFTFNPESRTLKIDNDGNILNLFINPICDMIYFNLFVAPMSFLVYEFDYQSELLFAKEMNVEQNGIFLPKYNQTKHMVPFRVSKPFMEGLILQVNYHLSSKYFLKILYNITKHNINCITDLTLRNKIMFSMLDNYKTLEIKDDQRDIIMKHFFPQISENCYEIMINNSFSYVRNELEIINNSPIFPWNFSSFIINKSQLQDINVAPKIIIDSYFYCFSKNSTILQIVNHFKFIIYILQYFKNQVSDYEKLISETDQIISKIQCTIVPNR